MAGFGCGSFDSSLPKPTYICCRMTSPRDAEHIRGLTLAVRAAQVTSSYHLEAALPITCRAAFLRGGLER